MMKPPAIIATFFRHRNLSKLRITGLI